MKKRLLFFILLILSSLSMNAQDLKKISADSLEMYKMAYKMIKSTFDKPLYNYTYEKYEPQKVFGKIELSEKEMAAVFDTLQANASISIDKTKYGNDLNLKARFPLNFNYKDLWKIGRINVLNSKLYNHYNKKLVPRDFGFTHFIKLKPELINGKTVANNCIFAELQSRLEKTSEVDSLCYGTVDYKISFISDYKKVNITKSDTLKLYKINNDSIKLIDIFENKVVIEELQNNTCCTDIQLLNTDSTGRIATAKSVTIEYDTKANAYKTPVNYAGEGSLTLTKEVYGLFRKNPEATLEEFIPKCIAGEKSGNYSKYIILESPAPINSNFMIYTPIYGFNREFEVSLVNNTKLSVNK